jgi:hypothetical protein
MAVGPAHAVVVAGLPLVRRAVAVLALEADAMADRGWTHIVTRRIGPHPELTPAEAERSSSTTEVKKGTLELQQKLQAPDCQWDLVVGDEAHKVSATLFGGEVKYTKRYRLAPLLSSLTHHLLPMTAPPHTCKEETSNFS